jgi:hypothetical protein
MTDRRAQLLSAEADFFYRYYLRFPRTLSMSWNLTLHRGDSVGPLLCTITKGPWNADKVLTFAERVSHTRPSFPSYIGAADNLLCALYSQEEIM